MTVLHESDRRALRWFLQGDYLGDVGVTSNFDAMIRQAEYRAKCKPPVYDYDARVPPQQFMPVRETRSTTPVDESRVVEVGRRVSPIYRRWNRISRKHQIVLWLVVVGKREYEPLGDAGPVVMYLRSTYATYKLSRSSLPIQQWVDKMAKTASAYEFITKLRHEAERHIAQAFVAWRQA